MKIYLRFYKIGRFRVRKLYIAAKKTVMFLGFINDLTVGLGLELRRPTKW